MDIAQRRFKVKLLLRGVMLQRFMVIFFIAVFGTGGAWGQIAPSQDLPVSEVYPVPELDFKQDLISPDLISPAQDYFGPVEEELGDLAVPKPVRPSGGFGGPGMGGPGMGGGPGYKVAWYPSRPVTNSQTPSELGLVRQSLSGGFPIWRQDGDTVLLTAGVRNTLFSTNAMLADTQIPFPDELWDINTGFMYIHKFDNGWSGGLKTTIGSASDKPFHSIEVMYANFFGFLETPAKNGRDSWRYSLVYSPVGNVMFPIPGLSYFWKPSDTFNANIGIPFSVYWKATDELIFTFSYIPVININARVAYQFRNGQEFYGAFEWLEEAYFLADSVERRERFLAFEKNLIGGWRWEFRANAALDLNAGYAFDRFYGEGQNVFSNLVDEVNVGAGAFVGAKLLLKF